MKVRGVVGRSVWWGFWYKEEEVEVRNFIMFLIFCWGKLRSLFFIKDRGRFYYL